MFPAETTPLITDTEIARRVRELAADIARDTGTDALCLIGLLNGSFMFAADLARELSRRGVALLTDFMTVSSYGNSTASSGEITVKHDASLNIKDRNVLVVDDIFDSGLTLEVVRAHLRRKGAGTLRTCVLLAKEHPGRAGAPPDYTGFLIGSSFVVGYGLDCGGRYRELPGIHTLNEATGEEPV